MISNPRRTPDRELVDIADYVMDFKVGEPAIDAARLCLTDTLACALDALDFPDCVKLVGPVVPGYRRAVRLARAGHASSNSIR